MAIYASIPLTIIIPYALAFLVLLISSYTDIKTREVPDWINFGLIGMGFGINLIFSIVYWESSFILNSFIGFGILFAFAWIMFYTGQWGGGDSKMLMGLGAIIGIDFFAKNFFLAHFLVNAMLVGAVYGILWSTIMILKNRKKFIRTFKKHLSNKKIKKARKFIILLATILILLNFFTDNFYFKLIYLYSAVIILLTFYLWIAVKAVENACMMKYVTPNQLTEGDWIAKDIKIDGKYITGPKDLGIEKKKIKKLIALYKQRKVKKILIKEGIPFVPSFFIAYTITLIYGNLVFLLL